MTASLPLCILNKFLNRIRLCLSGKLSCLPGFKFSVILTGDPQVGAPDILQFPFKSFFPGKTHYQQ